ncbi:hypothetical protein ACIBF1_00170 [Spirillospora sp. NPDC050679]
MRTRRNKAARVRGPLAELRVDTADPDPRFRAVLRERLLEAAEVGPPGADTRRAQAPERAQAPGRREGRRNRRRRVGPDRRPD